MKVTPKEETRDEEPKNASPRHTSAKGNPGVAPVYDLMRPALSLNQKAAQETQSYEPWPSSYGQLLPGVKVQKELPGTRFPDIDAPYWTAKSSISLVCNVTALPKVSPFKNVILSQDAVNLELDRFASSFSILKKGKSIDDLTFSCKIKSLGPLKSQSFKTEVSPIGITGIWASKIDVAPLTFERFTVTDDLSVQFKVTLIPKKQPPLGSEPVSQWQQMKRDHGIFVALLMMIAFILAYLATLIARLAFFIVVPPGNLGPEGEFPEDQRIA